METIKITKPRQRWLFGGVGFQNSEATMMPLMSEKFRNERVLKVFREISPTFSRCFVGYADWTKEAMDSFADYYDKTFRNAGTLLYAVPGRMPMITDDFNAEEYCEKVASNLDYLLNVRKCTKIRYYCVTNELSCGNTYAYLSHDLGLFKKLYENLYKAFGRHKLGIGLIATDCVDPRNYYQIDWAIRNMDEITEMYCAHLYAEGPVPGDPNNYKYLCDSLAGPLESVKTVEKRFMLGEFGYIYPGRNEFSLPMGNDSAYCVDIPEKEPDFAIALPEAAMAAINGGCFAVVFWTMFDYPDPFICENGDTDAEKARYDAARFSGFGLPYRYNKHGLVKWCDDEEDYGSRASLYTMGYMAKLFRKGSRVLKCDWDNPYIRACAVTNADGSVSIAAINWKTEQTEVRIESEHPISKPLRKYVFEAAHIPYNDFCDLQDFSGLVRAADNQITTVLPPRSITFLTADYTDRVPSEITGLQISDGKLFWNACEDEEHCYYRVYENGKQIASTVAQSIETNGIQSKYEVLSVDKWGNVRKR